MEEEKSYQEIRKELIEKYITDIVPKVHKYRKEWRELIDKYYGRGQSFFHIKNEIEKYPLYCFLFLIIFLFSIGIWFGLYFKNNDTIYFMVGIFMLFGLGIPICMAIVLIHGSYKESKTLYNNLKNSVMNVVCDCFSNLEYVSDGIHFTKEYKNAYVIPKNLSITYDDCLMGKHNGVQFIIEELKTKGIMASFKGVVIQCRLNKKFKGHTVIYPDSDLHISPSSNLHHTELEDIVFERKYDVYTNDDVEARYLITPGFMNRLNDVKSKFYADKIYVAFYDGVLYLALNTNKDQFEISSDKDICDKGLYYVLIGEIISIYKLIDHFKLNQNIGM